MHSGKFRVLTSHKSSWSLEKTIRKENYARNIISLENIEELDTGDFGSYARLKNGHEICDTMLSFHNDLSPEPKIRFLHKKLQLNLSAITSVLDLGCGAGFTTNALADLYKNAEVIGVDLSKDAIDWAAETFETCRFMNKAVSPSDAPIGDFNLIFCFEFYPFSRTDDLKIQKNYLEYLLSQLQDGGKIIIQQTWAKKNGLADNLDELQRIFDKFDFKLIYIPNSRILKLLKFEHPCFWVDKILRFFMRIPPNKALVVSKRQGEKR